MIGSALGFCGRLLVALRLRLALQGILQADTEALPTLHALSLEGVGQPHVPQPDVPK